MYGTDQATAVSAMPTPAPAGTPGYFTSGNPTTGQAATILDADWLNMVQQELLNVLTAAGITPSKTNYSQIAAAIQTLLGEQPGRVLRTSVYANVGGVQYVSVDGGAPTTTGASSWTALPGTTSIEYEGCGAGAGSSGAGGQGPSTIGLGASGGSGAWGKGRLTSGFSGTQTIAIGVGGTAGTAAPTNGGNGSATTFGTLASWPGGQPSSFVNGVTTPAVVGAGAGAAAPTGCNLFGSGGNAAESGVFASTSAGVSGKGGDTPYGAGGASVAAGSAGQAGTGYGSGASGAAVGGSGAGQPGAIGRNGILIVTERS
ncbi:hypothetical protein [Burkholderia sp. BCC0397]|uniref:glycine-rich domain-containing protein n=1 Tax=Burkholderia sp. BCC0397 TaxID=486876 RepID=UPI0015884E5C|nr:hypothetical protein [Burkholderia sp. BCC0397]